MKLIAAILLTALSAFVAGLWLPWWSVSLAAFLVAALVHQRPLRALLAGFLGIFLLWGGLALWIDLANNHLLSQKIAAILKLGSSSFPLVLITGIIGGLVGGVAALAGSFFRQSPPVPEVEEAG